MRKYTLSVFASIIMAISIYMHILFENWGVVAIMSLFLYILETDSGERLSFNPAYYRLWAPNLTQEF